MNSSTNRATCLMLLTLALMIPGFMDAQDYLHTSGTKIIDGQEDEVILRGMGLGGWMLQEGYMLQTQSVENSQHKIRQKIQELIGGSETDLFYDEWLANHVRKQDIDSLASWGFNSVRLPMHYNLFTLPIEDEPVQGVNTWVQKGFELTDSLLSWCEANELWLILDLHAAPGGQGKDQGISDYDPTKPSLWESEFNRSKTVSLWKKLAERYKDESWIGGYDLINETNWNMSGNAPLFELYQEITDSIRAVDQNHIIFIEGNWFANDFTGLTPPWDNNMVYSFHKYWSFNDVASIQWVLNIRDAFQVPIWLGESGENSNTWFVECIHLVEEHGIGWAWWPMKKVGSINCLYSVKKSEGYQKILDYWEGSGSKPSATEARDGLMQLAENLKSEHCDFRKDVVDALFRQIGQNSSIPYKRHHIPGNVFLTDFDMGPNGVAYFDQNVANYHLSTDNYTSWNQGWLYRNDGVDIETSEDPLNSLGLNVGWIEDKEWLKYTVKVDSTASYRITLRTAAEGSDGRFRYLIDSASIVPVQEVSATGDWQFWTNHVSDKVVLEKGEHAFVFMADKGGFNAGFLKFQIVGLSEEIDFSYLYAETDLDGTRIDVALNKSINSSNENLQNDFQVSADGLTRTIHSIETNKLSDRIISIYLTEKVEKSNQVYISYSGNSILAADGSILMPFTNELVNNKTVKLHQIPGKIEAEDYSLAQGIGTEPTTDAGGGLNIGWTDKGDILEYDVHVQSSGSYEITYRSSGQDQSGSLSLFALRNDDLTLLQTHALPRTFGWQTWENSSGLVNLAAGLYKLRIVVEKSGFNLNWFDVRKATGIDEKPSDLGFINIYPNPARDLVQIKSRREIQSLLLLSIEGSILSHKRISGSSGEIDISRLNSGIYLLQIHFKSGYIQTGRFVKN